MLIYRKKKNEIEKFTNGDLPLGYMEETFYHSNTVPFATGDVMVMFTNVTRTQPIAPMNPLDLRSLNI